MTTLDALAVADGLQLGPEYRAWLDALEAIGPPPGGIQTPAGEAAARLLAKLGVDEPDRAAVLDTLPSRRDESASTSRPPLAEPHGRERRSPPADAGREQ